jgi:putative spermidine/putrescine transport system permease protein
VVILFGGGLVLGCIQGLGYLPSAGFDSMTTAHFRRVLQDPDFLSSFGLTLYISVTSTIVAACLGVAAALVLLSFSGRYRFVHFFFQMPLTVPHLVIAVAVVFMLSPTGLMSRAAMALGFIESSRQFPLLINDRWGIGIMTAYIWKEVPFIALMVLAVLKNAGIELLDVGRTLKAGRWQRFRFIVLPLILPGLSAAGLIVFAFTFGAFEVPYLLGRTHPMMLPVWAYKNYSDVDLMARPEGIATGIVIAVVVAAAVVISQLAVHAAKAGGRAP